jgi:ribonuclease HI
MNQTFIYTDGACKRNPGPGGYGVVLHQDGNETVLSGGFRLTTNNRMEMLAAIAGLEALASPSVVTLTSDSKYLVDGITKGWARAWRRKNWKKADGKKALNPDLWSILLDLCNRHQVTFVWVRGHDGHPENERCDRLATTAAAREDLPVDEGYAPVSVLTDLFGAVIK